MNWITANAGTLLVGLVLLAITGLALKNVLGRKNTCSCGSCSGCCGCVKGKGREYEINRHKAWTGRQNHCN